MNSLNIQSLFFPSNSGNSYATVAIDDQNRCVMWGLLDPLSFTKENSTNQPVVVKGLKDKSNLLFIF